MTKRTVKNIEASIRAKLLNISRKTGENYNTVLLRFFQERFLARLGRSPYREHFVLKGGLLLLSQHIADFRPTVDIDMLGIGISNNPEHLSTIIKEIANIKLQDGVNFDLNAISWYIIKEDAEYQGLRFTFDAYLGKIKSKIRLDIGFGDAVPLAFVKNELPTILPEFSVPEIMFYPLESVVAEKFQAIVYLGLATSRMKDFYDILFLAKHHTFMLKKLKLAIDATFSRRKTEIKNRFLIYEPGYIQEKERQWKIFLRKYNLNEEKHFSVVVGQIREFLEPVIHATKNSAELIWNPKCWKWENNTGME